MVQWPRPRVRGAEDLAALWSTLPVAARVFPCGELPEGMGVLGLNGKLRKSVFRAKCGMAADHPCITEFEKEPDRCQRKGACRADALFPLGGGTGGAEQWRMATLRLNWYPSSGELWMVGLGNAACEELEWAAADLAAACGLCEPVCADAVCFADLIPRSPGPWRIDFVTPWVIDKQDVERAVPLMPEPDLVLTKLAESLSARAHKFSALCSNDTHWQRIAGHLARYATRGIIDSEFLLTAFSLNPLVLPSALSRTKNFDSKARGTRKAKHCDYEYVAWTGSMEVRADEAFLPWLGLLAICGLGENADKGFGQVEIAPAG